MTSSIQPSSRAPYTASTRLLLLIAAILAVLTWAIIGAPLAHAAAASVVAPPAVVDACQTQRTTDAKTADTPQLVFGTVPLAGCIADGGSGVSHLYVDWTGPHGTSGHVCADPAIAASGSWTCGWDTASLPTGAYTVTLTAYDLVGNRGSFDRKYEVVPVPPAPPAPTPPTTIPLPPPGAPPAPTAGTAPASTNATPTTSAPASTTDAPTSTTSTTSTTTTDSAVTSPLDPALVDPQPIAPQLPTADGLDPLQRLILDQIETCAQEQSAALAADPTAAAPDAGAQVALTCVQPALVQLGASSEDVDELPVPPALRIVFANAAQLETARHVLPLTLAGVPIELLTQAQLDAEQSTNDTATSSTSTTTG